MSYATERHKQDKTSVTNLALAFAIAAAILWPASYAISGNTPDAAANWWNATTLFAWILAAGATVGFAVCGGILISMQEPIEGDNR